MKAEIFKAYDIRGRYPGELDEKIAAGVAKALAENLFKKGKVVVAHDARLSSPELYRAILEALKIENLKLEIVEVGLATTPMFYFLVNDLKAGGGLMVTASHNPKEYNGIKAVGPKAAAISGTEIYELYKTLR